ncbi:MAG: HYR domain-containing protein, partial [Phycisphaerales bacterium]|nr:HYR domain-containing protein [Phycisphaerales bacterium]
VCASQGLTLVNFRPRPSPLPPTRLSDPFAGAIPTTTTDLAPFTMDSVAPTITCAPNITINANAGGCTGTLNFTNDFSTAPTLSATQAPGVWYTDRYAPAGFTSGPVPGGTGLVHSISSADSSANRPPAFNSTFYSTQGRKFDIDMPAGFKLGIDLYVPGSWATDIRRADIWGTAFDAQNAISGFPIIGFTSFNVADTNANAPSLPAQPRWRVWDTTNGAWVNLPDAVNYNAWNRLEIELTATSWVYRLNNAVVATFPNGGSIRIGNTIVQAFNFSQSYDVNWDNLTFGPQGPVATDNCELALNYVRSDNALLTLNDPFPSGTTNITWTATDCSGNTSSCVQTVTVNATSTFNTTVELSGVSSGTFTRCISFQFFGGCPNPAQTVDALVTFVNGTGTASISVPCGSYTCVTARDKRHTLRQTASLGVSMGNYSASFTGTDALRGGNLNDDSFVDILDFGGFVGQFGVNYGTGDTTCATPFLHADISGNGSVGVEDYTFIQFNFLAFNENNCCGNLLMVAPNTPGGPVTDISVAQLVAGNMWSSARGDLNRDGQLNVQDVALFNVRGMNTCVADFDNDGGVAVQDLFTYINSWFAGQPAADMDRNESLDTTDLFTFLNSWFRGC